VGGFGAAWIYTRSAGIWTQQGPKLLGTGGVGSGTQGVAVALSADGNTAIVGGYDDDGSRGAVWIYLRSGGVWTQEGGKLVASGAFPGQRQGGAVALSADGSTAIVGASNNGPGGAWIFTRSAGVWAQTPGVLLGVDAVGPAQQGGSVTLSGDGNTAVIGGITDDSNRGAAWVFIRSGEDWSQEGTKLVGSGYAASGVPSQGQSVSMSADGTMFLSGGANDSSQLGATWVFARAPRPQVQMAGLTASLLGGNAVRLEWSTTSETENYGFQIQRSAATPVAFETLPNSFVPGHGTTADPNSYAYIDSTTGDGQWLFRLRQISVDWRTYDGDPVAVEVVTHVGGSDLPAQFSLSQNYPNPFNPTTHLSFVVPQTSLVVLRIYDILGKRVATLVNEEKTPGEYTVTFDVGGLASGAYFYQLEAKHPATSAILFSKSGKMTIMK
jgi:hypothetical protein